ncbi:hypothetical protein CRT60_06075 [Azospirillum palustre]|uniref:Uncharacterized protein n=1 Tax=Azospirillum palustre TaxID=2044885 RepID=A0A2B8BN91_9PROT|nr:hypothetical protein CRT60_06075 [Azospirillum palustre]
MGQIHAVGGQDTLAVQPHLRDGGEAVEAQDMGTMAGQPGAVDDILVMQRRGVLRRPQAGGLERLSGGAGNRGGDALPNSSLSRSGRGRGPTKWGG